MESLRGKKLAYYYLKYITNNVKPTIDDIQLFITEVVRLDDLVQSYQWWYHNQLIENHRLQQENEFLIRELEKYEP